MKIRNYIQLLSVSMMTMMLFSCQAPGGNSTGSEYMPDMAHSVAYEANTYSFYSLNRWGTEAELHKMTEPRGPIAHTIARGYAGSAHEGRGVTIKPNGSVPYYYADTEPERLRAIAEIIKSPYPITDAGLADGKNLYNINCAICHGEKADGNGYLVREDGGKYPVQPANFMLDDLVNSSNGRYYHSIIYGKNLMGGYGDKLSYKERWSVIHYIRSLQAASKKLEYSEKVNTLNLVDVPGSKITAPLLVKNGNTVVDTVVVASAGAKVKATSH